MDDFVLTATNWRSARRARRRVMEGGGKRRESGDEPLGNASVKKCSGV